jgi:hypothetical protein
MPLPLPPIIKKLCHAQSVEYLIDLFQGQFEFSEVFHALPALLFLHFLPPIAVIIF